MVQTTNEEGAFVLAEEDAAGDIINEALIVGEALTAGGTVPIVDGSIGSGEIPPPR